MKTLKTIMIDDVEYVQRGTESQPSTVNGMDYVIVRSRDQGVMCGYLIGYEGRTVKLKNARQIWRYDSTFVLSDIAEKGVRDASKCKFSTAMSQEMIMLEACGILTCSKIGADSLLAVSDTVK